MERAEWQMLFSGKNILTRITPDGTVGFAMNMDANSTIFPVEGMTYKQWLVGTIAAGYVSDARFVAETESYAKQTAVSGRKIIAECAVSTANAIIKELNK